MGYELESAAGAAFADGPDDPGGAALERDWLRAHDRLRAALAYAAAVRRCLGADDPEAIAAELAVAEARQRCLELMAAVNDAAYR